jgi:hypothetical protein
VLVTVECAGASSRKMENARDAVVVDMVVLSDRLVEVVDRWGGC